MAGSSGSGVMVCKSGPDLEAAAVMSFHVDNNEAESRFETNVDGNVAVAEYEKRPGTIVFTHTEVPKELAGRGIAQEIVKTALEYAREKKLKVVPLCAYVKSYLERHPDYREL